MSVIIRLQNLPWNANALDIRKFFYGLSIPDGGVHIIGGEKGDAFIAFCTDEDARRAMMNDGGKINDLGIRLFLSSKSEMQSVIQAARGSVGPPPMGPIPKEPFGRAPLGQEGFGSNMPGPAMGGYDFGGQRNKIGFPPGGVPPPFPFGDDKRDNRPPLGGQNLPYSGRQDFVGGDSKLGSGIGVRPAIDGPPFGQRPPFDVRPTVDSKHPFDAVGLGARSTVHAPVHGFGDAHPSGVGGPKSGHFGEGNVQGSVGGNWGFPNANRDGGLYMRDSPSGNYRGMPEMSESIEKGFTRGDIGNRDAMGRGFEPEFVDKGRLFGNPDGSQVGFGKPELGRDFARVEDYNHEFRRFPDQLGRSEPGREFLQKDLRNDFALKDQMSDLRGLDSGRRNFAPQEVGREFQARQYVGPAEDNFTPDNRMQRFNSGQRFGENDGRDFGRTVADLSAREFGLGGQNLEDNGRRPGFPRDDAGPEFGRSDFARTDEGRFGGPFSRSEFISRPESGPGRDLSRDGLMASRDIPFGRNPLEEGAGFRSDSFETFPPRPGFGGPGDRAVLPEPGSFGATAWRGEQHDVEMQRLPGKRLTPPREFMERFNEGMHGPLGRRDDRRFGDGDAGRCLRVSNLPFSFNYREVRRLFVGCEIPGDGLKLVNDRTGKRTGLAYIKFDNIRKLPEALRYDGRMVENCKIIVVRCSEAEYEDAVDNYKPSRGGHLEGGRDRSRSPLRRRSSLDKEEKMCVVVKKLSPRTTELDVKNYFSKCCIAKGGGPYLEIDRDGLLTGCALVEFDSIRDFEEALFTNKRHRSLNGIDVKVIGIRKGEFLDRSLKSKAKTGQSEKVGGQGKASEAAPEGSKSDEKTDKNESKVPGDNVPNVSDASAVNKEKLEMKQDDGKPCCVELRGVPWSTSVGTIRDFFKGLSIAENGVHVILDREGRAAGSVYVEFATSSDCLKALERNRQYIGKRYIRVTIIGKKQMLMELSQQKVMPNNPTAGATTASSNPGSSVLPARSLAAKSGDVGNKGGEKTVSLKNLSSATQLEDILEFFHGYHPVVDSIKLQYKDGKPTGDGLTTFPSAEADSVVKLLNGKSLLGQPVWLGHWPA